MKRLNFKLFMITNFFCFGICIIACEKKENKETKIPVPSAYSSIDNIGLVSKAKGEIVYVPVYAHIPIGEKGIISMRSILSIRNTSGKEDLIVSAIDYFDTNGKLLKNFLKKPIKLAKMATFEVEISSLDLSGGSGANFIVKWDALNEISSPIIESLMYGANGPQSYSFISRGQIVEKH